MLHLEGLICWTNSAESEFGLLDASGGAILKAELNGTQLLTGQKVQIRGAALVSEQGSIIQIERGLAPDNRPLQVEQLGWASFPSPRQIFIDQILESNDNGFWAETQGQITQINHFAHSTMMELSVGNAHLRAEIGEGKDQISTNLMNHVVRLVGLCLGGYNTQGFKIPCILLVPSWRQMEVLDLAPVPMETNSAALPELTTADAVHHLSRVEAQRAYPVKIRGVVTGMESAYHSLVLQDASGGVYCDISNCDARATQNLQLDETNLFQVGEFIEIEGKTDPGYFAPTVIARRILKLGVGQLPEPIHPTWDQILNGSLDAQFVEIKGVVTVATDRDASILTPNGVIHIIVTRDGRVTGELASYLNSLIEIRGVLLAQWNFETHQVTVGEIRICDPIVTAEKQANSDVFSAPRRTPSDLLLFDPRASLFQRVCVSGQIIYLSGMDGFLMAGTNGLRFVARNVEDIHVGDKVDVAGLPELGGASPILLDAVLRKTGHTTLPNATHLDSANLNDAQWDSTRVSVEGVLIGIRGTKEGSVLDMQDAGRSFIARLDAEDKILGTLTPGCRLELTGVYAALSESQMSEGLSTTFELLLEDSPASIRVLARPPWWTPQRLGMAVGALVMVLVAAMLWIDQLHRKVERRTQQLEDQIKKRQLVERDRALEQERSRIAQDLHDELGSDLTEISMLAARAQYVATTPEIKSDYMENMAEKARQMVTSLDEIVWAMNPTHDSLASTITYLSIYAKRFLGLANMAWRLESPSKFDDRALDSQSRHQLFLAFKEALTNIVRHSGASEACLNVIIEQRSVQFTISDNGRGWNGGNTIDGMDGIANMRKRMEKLKGHFEIDTKNRPGTMVRFTLTLS